MLELSPTRALVNSSHGVTGVCKSNKNYMGMSKRQNQNQTLVTNIARMFFMKKMHLRLHWQQFKDYNTVATV